MQWTTTATPDALIVRPEGRIDESSWQAFTDLLIDALVQAQADGRRLVIDFAATDYMSSRGLRALTLARKEPGGTAMLLARPNPRMREILAISRYDRLFTVTDALP